jgi:hypothetical protein
MFIPPYRFLIKYLPYMFIPPYIFLVEYLPYMFITPYMFIKFSMKKPTYMSLFGPTHLIIFREKSSLHDYFALHI